jgi:hypothetical protein
MKLVLKAIEPFLLYNTDTALFGNAGRPRFEPIVNLVLVVLVDVG